MYYVNRTFCFSSHRGVSIFTREWICSTKYDDQVLDWTANLRPSSHPAIAQILCSTRGADKEKIYYNIIHRWFNPSLTFRNWTYFTGSAQPRDHVTIALYAYTRVHISRARAIFMGDAVKRKRFSRTRSRRAGDPREAIILTLCNSDKVTCASTTRHRVIRSRSLAGKNRSSAGLVRRTRRNRRLRIGYKTCRSVSVRFTGARRRRTRNIF